MNTENNLIENISEENVKQEMESEVCVSIKDATFAWPNSKIPVLAVDNLKIEEGKKKSISQIFNILPIVVKQSWFFKYVICILNIILCNVPMSRFTIYSKI